MPVPQVERLFHRFTLIPHQNTVVDVLYAHFYMLCRELRLLHHDIER